MTMTTISKTTTSEIYFGGAGGKTTTSEPGQSIGGGVGGGAVKCNGEPSAKVELGGHRDRMPAYVRTAIERRQSDTQSGALAAMREFRGAVVDLTERVEAGTITREHLQAALEAASIAADEIVKAMEAFEALNRL
jgi:hypothetical protein